MKPNAFALAVACAFLAGCSHTGAPLLPSNSAMPAFQQKTNALRDNVVFRSIYSFGNVPDDGAEVSSTMVVLDGTLYGTLYVGGADNAGAVYSLTPNGAEVLRHTFTGSGGAGPVGQLLNVNGVFYGTTYGGGASGVGTVYTLNPNGNFKVVRSFQGGTDDGAGPYAGVIDVSGTFYGTTTAGGSAGDGVVYSITAGGVEHVLHAFSGTDGSEPYGALVFVNGNFYGTTLIGGKYNAGTVYRISSSGSEKVLHSFGNGADGKNPYAGLTDVNGTLYGTTAAGGASDNGTVFQIGLGGKEKVLYSFDGSQANGCSPAASLTLHNGTLYGTSEGGAGSICNSHGTVFRIGTSGGETTLHAFAGGKGGAQPFAGLVPMGKKLYGGTVSGGYHDQGMAFSITP